MISSLIKDHWLQLFNIVFAIFLELLWSTQTVEMYILITSGPWFPFTAGLYAFLIYQTDLDIIFFFLSLSSYTHAFQLGEIFAYKSCHYDCCLLADSIQNIIFL